MELVDLVDLVELVELVESTTALLHTLTCSMKVEIDGEVENLRAVVSLMISHRPVTLTMT